jgi:hypothetical protein
MYDDSSRLRVDLTARRSRRRVVRRAQRDYLGMSLAAQAATRVKHIPLGRQPEGQLLVISIMLVRIPRQPIRSQLIELTNSPRSIVVRGAAMRTPAGTASCCKRVRRGQHLVWRNGRPPMLCAKGPWRPVVGGGDLGELIAAAKRGSIPARWRNQGRRATTP